MKNMEMLGNEEGSVLIVALIMLVLLTIIGISASSTSNIEIQISGNEKIFKQNFFRAEAAAMHGVQGLEDTDLAASPPSWLIASASDDEIRNVGTANDFWVNNASAPTSLDAETRYFAVEQGVAMGSSLDMSKSKVFEYKVYGRSTQNNGRVIIDIGYRKAFKN